MTEILANINNLKDEFYKIQESKGFEQYKQLYKFSQKISVEIPTYYNEILISDLKIEPLEKATVKKLREDYSNQNYETVFKKLNEIAFIKPSFQKRNNKLDRILNDEQGNIWEVSQELINQLKFRLGFR